ncbi:hypothetical protein SAVERM_1p101 (plasmid) [Streptomyces avermitilis MA-4680 = NBRC 14893]|uniref:Uncharacterized protein n=1 Tax=Streptomyces avermitilis (strain ATCC 31267 / DSM 46492 / JCM 5070 / NBRC 14893 / NCIMB 12804 / NRRL 8165 / MA-4680) TaxID=227882 RepID=A0A146FC12_STRAW|nr:hypothetical protein SAVERM_1p101 [Streptomyces avermitilis MA-4680 = NBRC 14893]
MCTLPPVEITRDAIACALCHTPTTELVYLVLSAQSPYPQREDVKDRWCPAAATGSIPSDGRRRCRYCPATTPDDAVRMLRHDHTCPTHHGSVPIGI